MRRALIAGGVAWLVVSAPLVASVVAGDTGGRAAYVVTVLGLLVGSALTAAWLLAAAALDLLGGAGISRRRGVWTVVTCLMTLGVPLLWLGGT